MGMASSQARLLSLTSRQHSIELKAQVLQAQKLQLANDSDAAYDNYVKTLDATKLQTKLFNQDGKQAWVEASVNNLMRINSPETYGNTFLVKNIDDGKIYLPQSVAEKYESANGDEERFLQLNGITCTTVEDSTAKDAAKAKVDEAIAKGWGKLPKHEDFGELTSDIYYNYKALNAGAFDAAKSIQEILKRHDNNNLQNEDYETLISNMKAINGSGVYDNDENIQKIFNSTKDSLQKANTINLYQGQISVQEGKNNNDLTSLSDLYNNPDSPGTVYDEIHKIISNGLPKDGEDAIPELLLRGATKENCDTKDPNYTYKISYLDSGDRHVLNSNGNTFNLGWNNDAVTDPNANIALLFLSGGVYNSERNVSLKIQVFNGSKDANNNSNADNKDAAACGLSEKLWSDGFVDVNFDYPISIKGTLVTNLYDDELQAAIDAYFGDPTRTPVGYERNVSGVLDSVTTEVLSYEQYADEVEQYDTAYENYVQYTVDLQEYKNTPVNKYVQYNNSVSGPYYENLFKAIQLSDGYHVISNAQAKDGDWVNSMARSGKVVLSIYETDKKEINDYSAFSHPGLQEVANEGEMAVADVEYENALDAINSKELKISRRLSRLETERAAIKTEIDSIKQIRSDNINVAFKVFG